MPTKFRLTDKGQAEIGRIMRANATETLRRELRSARAADMPLFNYGPDIETLRATCLAETGLPAPLPPLAARLQPAAMAAE